MTKIPLYLLNGPLGAGKTTLLRQLLDLDQFSHARVIENEFASTSIDTQTLHEHQHEVSTIAGTCICCGTGEELVDALRSLSSSVEPVIVEATGVANSLKIIEKLVAADLLDVYSVAHAVFVLDGAEAAHDMSAISSHQQELRAADTVVVSKRDLIADNMLGAILQALKDIPVQRVITMAHGSCELDFIAGPSSFLRAYIETDTVPDSSDDAFNYTVIDMTDIVMSPQQLELIWNRLKATYGLRRMKGYMSDGQNTWHIEATPTQFRSEPSRSVSRELVVIGEHAVDIGIDEVRE